MQKKRLSSIAWRGMAVFCDRYGRKLDPGKSNTGFIGPTSAILFLRGHGLGDFSNLKTFH